MTTAKKKAHVRSAMRRNETFDHHCHWPECKEKVPPAMWGCKSHWLKLPKALRDKVWASYEPGQEITKNPLPLYLEVVTEIQEWIKTNGKK